MAEASRRGFLALAGTTAAAAGVVTAMPAANASEPATASKAAKVHGPVIAYLSNPATGELTVMHGSRSVTVHDRDLVARVTAKLEQKG